MPIPLLEVGELANITIFSPEQSWNVDHTKFKTMSLNGPFDGWELKGRPVAVVNRGVVVWCDL